MSKFFYFLFITGIFSDAMSMDEKDLTLNTKIQYQKNLNTGTAKNSQGHRSCPHFTYTPSTIHQIPFSKDLQNVFCTSSEIKSSESINMIKEKEYYRINKHRIHPALAQWVGKTLNVDPNNLIMTSLNTTGSYSLHIFSVLSFQQEKHTHIIKYLYSDAPFEQLCEMISAQSAVVQYNNEEKSGFHLSPLVGSTYSCTQTKKDRIYLALFEMAEGKELHHYWAQHMDTGETRKPLKLNFNIQGLFGNLGTSLGKWIIHHINRNQVCMPYMWTTLAHNDLHPHNIFYNELTQKFTLIDWGEMTKGEPLATDAAYFVNFLLFYNKKILSKDFERTTLPPVRSFVHGFFKSTLDNLKAKNIKTRGVLTHLENSLKNGSSSVKKWLNQELSGNSFSFKDKILRLLTRPTRHKILNNPQRIRSLFDKINLYESLLKEVHSHLEPTPVDYKIVILSTPKTHKHR